MTVAPSFLAQTVAQGSQSPLPTSGNIDFSSPATILIAVVFGSWLMTKRKDSQAHEIIVTDRVTARERAQADTEQITKLMGMVENLQTDAKESKETQIKQAGELGELRQAVTELRRDLTEARAEVTRLRDLLTAAEARVIIEVANRKAAEADRDVIREKLEVSQMRLKAMLEAKRETDGSEPDEDGLADSSDVPPLKLD